jgi:hypothetical protein
LMISAELYFGNNISAQLWFQEQNSELGSVTPFSLCDSFLGMSRVNNSIMKLKCGMTA